MKLPDLRERLAQHPQLPLNSLPSPLQPLPRISRQLGSATIWIKRDDELGPALGGNKGRKLSYLLAEALKTGKTKIVTYGGLQSNHVRMTAGACAALGLDAHLFFFERRPSVLTGNLFLNQLLGARMYFIPFGGGGDGSLTLETVIRLVKIVSLLRIGRSSYFIPGGGHNTTGGLGYVAAACEIVEQIAEMGLVPEKVTVITAVGTGGTLAGLMAGFALLESPVRVLGLDIGKLWKNFPDSIARLAMDLCRSLGHTQNFSAANVPMIENVYAGPGYSLPAESAQGAIRLLGQTEGIILDPVYTGKAFAGMLDLIGSGRFTGDDQLIFLHTGGLPALWAS